MGTGRRALVQGKCWATGPGGTGTWLGQPHRGQREHGYLLSAKRCGVCQVRVGGRMAEPRVGPSGEEGRPRPLFQLTQHQMGCQWMGRPFTNRALSGQAGIPVNP